MDKAKEILMELHKLGGCDAQDEYFKGWDDAITAAIHKLEEVTGADIAEVLEEEMV